MKPVISTLLGLCAISISACGTTGSENDEVSLEEALNDPRVGEKTDRICFSRGINGFREWKDGPDGLILDRGVNNEYLVLVGPACLTLDRAQRIGIDDRFGGGCLSRGDSLFISDSIFPSNDRSAALSIDRCRISAIYEWNEDAAEDINDSMDSE